MSTVWEVEAQDEQTPVRHRHRPVVRTRPRDPVLTVLVVLLVVTLLASMAVTVWGDAVRGTLASAAAPTWNVQGNITNPYDGSEQNWGAYGASSGGALAFVIDPSGLQPGTTAYTSLAVRLDPAKDLQDTNLTLAGAHVSGSSALMSSLTYAVRIGADSSTCNQVAFPTVGAALVPAGTPLTTGGAASGISVTAGGTPVHLCFAVTLPSDATTTWGERGRAVWELRAPHLASDGSVR